MKKILLFILLLTALRAPAILIMSETFDYNDGTLISTAPNWTAHSGAGVTPLTVVSNQLQVILSNTEDDSVLLPGAPYNSSGTVNYLFASMTLNCQGLPGLIAAGNDYFAHFKDTSSGAAQTNGFRCRLYAYTDGAATNKFRLGITSVNGGTPGLLTNGYVTFPLDLATNTNYQIVMRLNPFSGESVLWINPATGTTNDLCVTNIDPIPNNGVDISYFAFRQTGSGGSGQMNISKLKIATAFTDVAGTNTPPTVSTIPNQNMPMSTSGAPLTLTVPFVIGDDHFDASLITNITATSTNSLLLQNSKITFGGSGANRTLTIAPSNNRQGLTAITLSVRNPGGAVTTNQFFLTVGAPSISTIPAQILAVGGTPQAIPFTVGDHESSPGTLTLSAYSSNTGLVPTANITFTTDGNSNRTVTVTPAAGQAGIVTIGVKVSDSVNVVSNNFTYTVAPQLGVLFTENFDAYADGSSPSQYHDLTFLGVPSPWITISGTAYQLMVSNKQAYIDQSLTEDIAAGVTNAPLGVASGAVVYYGFKVMLTSLPGTTGDYFITLRDTNTSFRAKVFACTTNASSGTFRLGISNGANSPPNAQIQKDLYLNNPYFVVVRYNVGSAVANLWLNSVSETDPNVTATDGQSPSEIDAVVLRQQTFEGVEVMDNLVISTAFADVKPAFLPPAFSVISNQSVAVSGNSGAVAFNVSDLATPANSLTLGVFSDNTNLVPTANVVLAGTGTNRTVTVTPTTGQSGFANISIMATNNAGLFATTRFLVTVGNPPTNGIVISQIYPGGGNTNATYTTKFVEIFNHSQVPVSLNNWSLQYASASGTAWSVGNFANVLVPAGSYYLVAVGPVGTIGTALPLTPDVTLSGLNPSQSAGKFALCNSSVGLGGANPVASANVVDLVGWGGALGYEGSGSVAWTTDNTLAMFRLSSGCIDHNDNTNDFMAAPLSQATLTGET